MNKYKFFSNGIFTGLIGSIIFAYFINPIFKSTWKFLNSFTNSQIENFINNVYSNAALGKRNWLDYLNYMQLNVIVITFIIIIFITFNIQKKIRQNAANGEIIKNKRTNKFFIKFAESRFFNLLFGSLIILLIFDSSKMIFTAYVDLQINTSFDQRITIIAPNIDDHEYKIIRSKWCLMNSKNDYKLINSEIDSIAKKKQH